MVHHRALLTSIALAASILIRYDTMEILVYVDPDSETQTTAELVSAACATAHSLDLALPTPYRIQWRKRLSNGAFLPDESRVVTGMLTTSGCTKT